MRLQTSNKSKYMRMGLRNPDMAPIDIAKSIYTNFNEDKFRVMKEIAPNIIRDPGTTLTNLGVEAEEKWIGDAIAELCSGVKVGARAGIEPALALFYYGLAQPEFITLELLEDNELVMEDVLKFWVSKDNDLLFDLTEKGMDEHGDICDFLDSWGMSISEGILITDPKGYTAIVNEFADILMKTFHTSLEGNQTEFIDYLAINYANDIKDMGLLIENVTIEEMAKIVGVHRYSPILEMKDDEEKALALIVYGAFKIMMFRN